MEQEIQPQQVVPNNNKRFFIITGVVIAVIAIIATVAFFLFLNKQNAPGQDVSGREAQEKLSATTNKDVQQTKLDVIGHILFVKEGDLWQMSAEWS